MMARLALASAFMTIVFIAYLALAWMVVMNTDACWWPWQELTFPGGRGRCTLGM